MTSDEVKMEKLNSENYKYWSQRMRGILIAKQCWVAVDGGPGDNPTAGERAANEKAVGTLLVSINDDALDNIEGCETAKEIWDRLKDTHNKFDLWHGMLALKEYATLEKSSDEKMTEYLSKRNKLLYKVKGAGIDLTEQQAAAHTVMGLPPEYENFARNIKCDDPNFSFQKFKNQLLEEEPRMNARHSKVEESDDRKAMNVRGSMRYGRPNLARGRGNENRGSRGGGRGYRGNAFDEKGIRCYRCQEYGHIGRNCPKYGDLKKDEDTDTKNPGDSTAKIARNNPIATWFTKYSAINENVSKSFVASKPNEWILDSGATDHMTDRRDLFVTFTEESSPVEIAGGGKLQAKGHGDVQIELSNECGGKHIKLANTLYVPNLNGNLISATRLTGRGRSIKLTEEGAEIINGDGKTEGFAIRKENLFYICEQPHVAYKTIHSDIALWHKRMGHLHVKAIEEKIRKNEVFINATDEYTSDTCESCIEGKMKSFPFPKLSESRTNRPLELIHSDVLGDIKPPSEDGAKYAVTFIDDYSRYGETYLLKRKSEVYEKFKEYKAHVENKFNLRIQALRTDRGGEYMNKEFDELLKQEGIQRQLTIPGTSQQNDVCERRNLTLANVTRCMLIDSGLPLSFWGEAISTATYVRNRCPTAANKGVTPYERFHGINPDISHLRTFGCQAWYKIKKPKAKFAPRAEKGIMVGYSSESKAYRIYNPITRKIILARDVTFDENVFPAKQWKHHRVEKAKEWATLYIDAQDDHREIPIATPEPSHTNAEHHIPNSPIENISCDVEESVAGSEARNSDADETEYSDINFNQPLSSRSGRQIIPPAWSKDYVFKPKTNQAKTTRPRTRDPQSVEEAMQAYDGEEWKEAMAEEFENLMRNRTWNFVKRTNAIKAIRTKWSFKRKYDENGRLTRHRARVVALGNEQRPGIDYDKTYSPVVKMKTTRTLLAIAVKQGWSVHHLDIIAAYLLADIEDEAYIEIPNGFTEASENLRKKYPNIPNAEELASGQWVCKLEKCMYGLHQSGRRWNETLDAFLKAKELARSRADPCVYFNMKREIIVTTYVDDLVLYGKTDEIGRMKKVISEEFETRDLGILRHVQSICVTMSDNSIRIDQTAYANEILREFNMSQSKPTKSPLTIGGKYEKANEQNKLDEAGAARYRKAIGSLLYLATGTRPDLAYATTYLSQFSKEPSTEHWQAVKHVLRYVQGTKNYAIEYTKNEDSIEFYTTRIGDRTRPIEDHSAVLLPLYQAAPSVG